MVALYFASQIRALETQATSSGISEEALIKRAGQAALSTVTKYWPKIRQLHIFCGKGKNAGDGLALGLAAHAQGFTVNFFMAPTSDCHPLTVQLLNHCKEHALPIHHFPKSSSILKEGLIIDALFGTGLTGNVKDPYLSVIKLINHSGCPILALDVPSGLDSDKGVVMGAAVKAAMTLTFVGAKPGLYTADGPVYCGEILIDTLKIPPVCFKKVSSSCDLLAWENIRKILPAPRLSNTHKKDYGAVLVIGGDYGMGGAVRMAAEAAARVGAMFT